MIMLNFRLKGTIEIDEAVITGKRKYNQGRAMTRIYWVFGLYSREDQRGYAFMIPNKKINTIFSIIEKYLLIFKANFH